MCRCQRVASAAALIAVLIVATASAQRIWVGAGRFWRTPPKWATRASFDGSFNYCRGYYTSNRHEAGGSRWDTDFLRSANQFSVRLAEIELVRRQVDISRPTGYLVVRLTHSLLFRR